MAMKDESNDYECHNDLGICTLFDGHDEVLKGAYQHTASTITGTQTLMYLAAPQQSRPGKPMHCTSTRRSVLYVLLQTEHLPQSMHYFMATNWFKVDYPLLLRYFSFQKFEHQKHLPQAQKSSASQLYRFPGRANRQGVHSRGR